MLPLELFRSRQFASANLLALVTYAALGGVIFLFVAFLQITLGYTALQAGAATLPITLLLLTLSTPSGAIAQLCAGLPAYLLYRHRYGRWAHQSRH